MEGYQEKHNKQEEGCYKDLSLPSPLIRISRDLKLSFSSWYREGDISTNGDFLYKYKMVTSAQFSELLSYLLFFKN